MLPWEIALLTVSFDICTLWQREERKKKRERERCARVPPNRQDFFYLFHESCLLEMVKQISANRFNRNVNIGLRGMKERRNKIDIVNARETMIENFFRIFKLFYTDIVFFLILKEQKLKHSFLIENL